METTASKTSKWVRKIAFLIFSRTGCFLSGSLVSILLIIKDMLTIRETLIIALILFVLTTIFASISRDFIPNAVGLYGLPKNKLENLVKVPAWYVLYVVERIAAGVLGLGLTASVIGMVQLGALK